MRIVDIRERTFAISRYADPSLPTGGLTTSAVTIVTDVIRNGKPIQGHGFASIGRFAQGGLIRERFAPRLLAATSLADDTGTNLDPFAAHHAMMQNEKPGGHGERCVAVGTLDMAIWDAAAKIAGLPLHRFLADKTGRPPAPAAIPVYAGGGYLYPTNDLARLSDETKRFVDLGYTRAKLKIGARPLATDLARIDAAAKILGHPSNLAVDAMNTMTRDTARQAAAALSPIAPWWFEDICDPLDFDTQADIAARYKPPIAAGEALFSAAEARLLHRYAGLRPTQDILLFDPVHCYGIPGYLQIIHDLEAGGWPRSAFWPHGGHLFCLHIVAALGLGGAEVNPLCFHPFGGYGNASSVRDGFATLPDAPGIAFELMPDLMAAFATV